MLTAHYQGIIRVGLSRPELAGELSLSSQAYAGSLRALKSRFEMPVTQLDALAARYEAEAVRVIQGVSAAVEKRVQQAIIATQSQGLHVAAGLKELGRAFKASGLTPRNSFTLEAVFRTQSHMAYSAGRWHANQHPAIDQILWGYEYVTVGDDRVRASHEALDGTKLSKNDPQWNVLFPPNGWACRCQAIEVFDEEEVVRPPQVTEINGRQVIPGADAGFRFNPGRLFGGMEPPVLKSRRR
jgi:SPP1 gp7 family putative phage head morphogenesis protein